MIEPAHNIGDEVYLKTDPDQLKRMVIGYTVRSTGVLYLLACGEKEGIHYDIEITKDKPSTAQQAGFKK